MCFKPAGILTERKTSVSFLVDFVANRLGRPSFRCVPGMVESYYDGRIEATVELARLGGPVCDSVREDPFVL